MSQPHSPPSPPPSTSPAGHRPTRAVTLSAPAGAGRRLLGQRSFLPGVVMTALLPLTALLSFWWTPGSAYDMDMDAKLAAPGALHWLGTDAYGRDVASLLFLGARSSILVGVIAVGIGLSMGVALGLVAAACRGWVEEAIMRLADFSFAFPALLPAIRLTAVFVPGIVNPLIAIRI